MTSDTPRTDDFYCNPPENEAGYEFAQKLERELGRLQAVSWITGNKPDTPLGSSTLMWVTMQNKETGVNKTGILTYLNRHVMRCSDSCFPPDCAVPHNPEEDGYHEEYEWTCWSNGSCNVCETEWVWTSNYTEIIAYSIITEPEPYNATTLNK